jgi:L-aspartate oxidase
LKLALAVLKELEAKAAGDLVLSNMVLTARLIAGAALMRKESRGGHFRSDYPMSNPSLAHRTFITIDDLDAIAPKRPAHPMPAMACRT